MQLMQFSKARFLAFLKGAGEGGLKRQKCARCMVLFEFAVSTSGHTFYFTSFFIADQIRHYDPKRREFYYHSAYLVPRLGGPSDKLPQPPSQSKVETGPGNGVGPGQQLIYFDPYTNQFIVSYHTNKQPFAPLILLGLILEWDGLLKSIK